MKKLEPVTIAGYNDDASDVLLTVTTNGTGSINVEGNVVGSVEMKSDEFQSEDRERLLSVIRDAMREW